MFKIKSHLTAVLLGLTSFSCSAILNAEPPSITITQLEFKPVEGKEYSVLTQPIKNAPTVIEFFSFHCFSCYNYQFVYQIPQKIEKGLNDGETMRYINVDGLLDMGTITQAWALAEKLNKGKEIMNELYYGIQTEKSIKQAEDMKQLLMKQFRLTENDFFTLWDSKEVIEEKEQQLALAKQAKVKSTPTFIVNGKYKINVGELKSDSHEQFIEKFMLTLNYLKNR